MKKFTVVENNGKVNIQFNGSVFIIPNHAGTVDGFVVSKDKYRKFMEDLCDLNSDQKFDPEDNLVQVWIHSEDLNCDNVTRHNPCVKHNDKEYWLEPMAEYIPSSLLRGHKEGDTIQFTYPLEDEENVTATINMKLEQLPYRYGSFGSFEEVLDKVCY